MSHRLRATAACFCLLFCIAGDRAAGQDRGLLVVNVRDETGKLLDARVVITMNGEFVVERDTYQEGLAKVPVPLQPYTVTISNPDYYSQSLDVSSPTFEETVSVTLVPLSVPTSVADPVMA